MDLLALEDNDDDFEVVWAIQQESCPGKEKATIPAEQSVAKEKPHVSEFWYRILYPKKEHIVADPKKEDIIAEDILAEDFIAELRAVEKHTLRT